MNYSYLELLCYFLIYAFLGWAVDVLIAAIRDRGLTNCGFFNLPLNPSWGITMVILAILYPYMNENSFLIRFLSAAVISDIVLVISTRLAKWMTGRASANEQEYSAFSGNRASLFIGLIRGLICMSEGILLQPLLVAFVAFFPDPVKKILCAVILFMMTVDLILILTVTHRKRSDQEINRLLLREIKSKFTLEERISSYVFRRLDKAYPGWENKSKDELPVFAKGYGLYKMVWVFAISALVGDLVETVYVWATSGSLMSRSSLIYGPFSVVWGFGAVLLTLMLHRLADREDRYIFLAGGLIGGVYEYTCSVVSEAFLGTRFWDYSEMPLNVGGRTNLLYCFFWGILAVIWVKKFYPPLSGMIEKIPVIAGTVITWVLVMAFVMDGSLTASVMVRYVDRQNEQEAEGFVDEFLDRNYPDSVVKNRWRNMKLA